METLNQIDYQSIVNAIDFTEEEYGIKAESSETELVPFFMFINNIIEEVKENSGTFEDAIFMANDAYHNLPGIEYDRSILIKAIRQNSEAYQGETFQYAGISELYDILKDIAKDKDFSAAELYKSIEDGF